MQAAWAYRTLAQALRLDGDYSGANAAAEKVISILDQHKYGVVEDATTNYFMSLAMQGQGRQAEQIARQRLQQLDRIPKELRGPIYYQQTALLKYGLGCLYEYQHRIAESMAAFESAGEIPVTPANWRAIGLAQSKSPKFSVESVRQLMNGQPLIERENINRQFILKRIERNLAFRVGNKQKALELTLDYINNNPKIHNLWPRELELRMLVSLSGDESDTPAIESAFQNERNRIGFASRSNIYRLHVQLHHFEFKVKTRTATTSDLNDLQTEVDYFVSDKCTAPDSSKEKVATWFSTLKAEYSELNADVK